MSSNKRVSIQLSRNSMRRWTRLNRNFHTCDVSPDLELSALPSRVKRSCVTTSRGISNLGRRAS
eukprot:scaffold415936_cov43-Prasinocladus_malaysianus.AAC.1